MEAKNQITADHNPEAASDRHTQTAKLKIATGSESKKTLYLATCIFLAWSAIGYLSYLSAQYFDLYVLSEAKYFYLIDRIHIVFPSETAKFFIYHTYYMFSSLALAFLFSGLFAAAFDFKLLWLAGFYGGASLMDIFHSYSSFASAAEVYATLPAHLANAAQADLIKFVILLPLAIYFGAMLGRNLKARLKNRLYGDDVDMFFSKENI